MNRRKFIHGTVTTLAMPFIAKGAQAPKIKIGQIGLVHAHSRGKLGAIRALNDEFELVGVVELDEGRRKSVSGNQDVNHLEEKYDGKTPDIIDNAFVIVDFENGVRGMLDLCMFAENSEYQEEIVAVGNIGKIETFVPSSASGKDSSEVKISLRKNNITKSNEIKVDKQILAAGHHHGSTYFEHLAFIDAIQKNKKPEVSLKDGLMSVAIGEAAENSIKENRVVFMEEFKL